MKIIETFGWNPDEGIEDEASMQDSSITEQGV